MKSVAYKWRVSTTEYAYLTDVNYDKTNPNFTLGGIRTILPDDKEKTIIDIVKNMSSTEYEACFKHITKLLSNRHINLRNWEYYYNLSTEGCIDCEDEMIFYGGATAKAEISEDGSVDANVELVDGVLNFSFLIPRGLEGAKGNDGKDGLDGEPGKDGVSAEYIYALSTNNNVNSLQDPNFEYDDKITFNQNGYVPYRWSDRPSGITETHRYEWVSLRKRNQDGTWDKFSEPKLMSRWGEDGKDGDGIEYIYKRTKTNDTPKDILTPEDWEFNNEYQENDEYYKFIPGWSDNPMGISEEYKFEWVSTRKQKDTVWQPFSSPQIWARWGEDGKGSETIYCITDYNDKEKVEKTLPSTTEDAYQTDDYIGENGIWFDNYIEPTYEKKYAWVSTRKKTNGIWGEFSEPKLWNTYKVAGKTFVDVYMRSNITLNENDLPSYDGDLFYSFIDDEFYSDEGKKNLVTTIGSNNDKIWYTDIPSDNSLKYLYKANAQVVLNEDLSELVKINKNEWWGPYLIASNGENAINNAPYIIFDDSSFSLPIRKEDNKPHEAYQYSFNAMLYFSDKQIEILGASAKSNTNKIKNLVAKTNSVNPNTKVNDSNISFNIDNSQEFNTIEFITVTLRGRNGDEFIEATAQFKIIPFITDDAILYRILLNNKVVFVPSDTCTNENGLGPWHIVLSGAVVDNRGNNVGLDNDRALKYQNKEGSFNNLTSGLTIYACNEEIDFDTSNWVKITDLPNPLAISYVVNDAVREIEYVHFVNMPVDGIDGISSRMIFAYTSTNENEKPSTPSGGSVNFDDNTIEYPKSYDENGNETYIWGANNDLSGVVWLTQCEFFSDGTSDLVWSTPVRLTGFKGVDSVHLELSNDMDQVYTTDGEVKIDDQKVETIVTLMNGGEKLLLPETGVTATGKNFNCTCTKIDDYSVKVSCVLTSKTIDENVKHNNITILVDGDVYGNSNADLSKTFKIAVLNGTLDFDLDVSHTVIKRNKLGNYSTDKIMVYVTKRDIATNAKQVDRISVETFSEYGLEVEYYFNNDKNSAKPLTSNNISIPNNNIEKITLLLYRHKQLIDSVTVDCVFDGIDGSAYHLELSNEMDQVYVTDNKILISGQTILSTVNLYNNTIGADNDIVNIGFEDKHSGICTSKISPNTNGDVITSHTMSITFLTGKTVNDDVINFKITATTKNETTISREFKVIKLNGTKDYDLLVTPTYVKANKNGDLTSNNVSIKIVESDISTNERVVKELVTLPTNISLYHKVNGGTEQKITNYNSGTTVEIDNKFEKIEIILKKTDGGITKDIDYVKVEKISDGADGLNGSAYSIDLSNDLDQVYVVDNIVKHKQTIKTTVFLYDGINKVDPSECTYYVDGDKVNNVGYSNSGTTLSFVYNENTTITADTINHEIKTVYKDKIFVKTFKLVKLNGTIDYDLLVNPTIIKKDKNGTYTPSTIEVKVNKTDISTVDRTITELKDFENTNFKIKVDIDGTSDTKSTPSFKISSNTINKYATIELLSGTTLLDYCYVEVVSDGIDGVSGDTPCHIEMSNDMDQVLTIDNKAVKDDQTITTDISVYRGTNLITSLTEKNVEVTYDDKLWSITASTENGIIKYSITPINGAEFKNREYDFSFTVSGDVIGTSHNLVKKFKVIRIDGTKDYDLYANHTIVKKSLSGYSVSSVTIEVKETDFSRLETKVTTVSKLNELGLNLLVKIDGSIITRYTYDSGVTFNLNSLKPAEKIYLELSKNGLLVDYINIEIVSDGKNGEDGVDGSDIQFIYCLGENEDSLSEIQNTFNRYSGSTKEDILNVTGETPWWTDSPSGISESYKIEVCSQRTKNAGSKSWSNWCTPFIWAKWGENGIDGDGVEYIFYMSDKVNVPENPGSALNSIKNGLANDSEKNIFIEIVNLPDFVPGDEWVTKYVDSGVDKAHQDIANKLNLGWADNPSDVGPYEPVEYVSIRRKTVKPNGSFEYIYTDPKVWAEWKRDTYDSITEFIFAVDSRDLSSCRITGGTWKNLKEKTGHEVSFIATSSGDTTLTDVKWYDSVPNHNNINQYIWMVKGYASGEITYTGGTDNIPTGITYSPINWTSPTKMMDSQFMQVEYSCIEGNGEIPSPIQLEVVKEKLGDNYSLTALEAKFRELDGAKWDWKDSSELSGATPVWMITSTFYNGVWSEWTVSRIKGEQGEKGENGQGVSIKGSFSNEEELKYAYYYYMQDKTITSGLSKEIGEYKTNNPDKVSNGKLKTPSKEFLNNELVLGDSYIIDTTTIDKKIVNGYLFIYTFENDIYSSSWAPVGQVRGDSSYIYIAYANDVVKNNTDITYYLTSGGTNNGKVYYGTTPGKYIGIHAATQQYEGHPYPDALYGSSARTNDTKFIWSKWEGDDGFGQEQIFVLSGETAPSVPTSANTKDENNKFYTKEVWNGPGFTPRGWSDKPLTPTSGDEKTCCWMVVRKYPYKGSDFNEFSGDTNNKAILFSRYSKDGINGASGLTPYHVELTNDFDLVSVLNGNVNGTQKISTEIKLYEGNLLRNATAITLYNIDNITTGVTTTTTDGCNYYKLDLTVTDNTEFKNSRNITIIVNNAYEAYLTIKPIESTILYQLVTDKGFVTKGSNSTIIATVKSKTNDGLVSIGDNLPSGMTIDVYKNNNEFLKSGTTTSLTYDYEGGADFNEIDFRLKLNGNIYDNVNVEVKEKIKKFASLDLTPLDIIVYVDSDNKPLVSSITLNGAFIYEGNTINLNSSALTISVSTEDFETVNKYENSLELVFSSGVTITSNTSEYYVLKSEYESDVYENVIHVNYVKGELEISALYDTLYIPDEVSGENYTIELNTDVTYNGVYVTNECILSSEEEDIIFNQRGGKWCINIPKDYCNNKENTGITVTYEYNGIKSNKDYILVRKGIENSFFINVYPQRLNDGETPIELYITKNSYNGEYVSLNSNGLVLKYKIDNDEEVEYNFDNAPKLHGNIVFYPNGYKKVNIYEQEPIYNKIQFNLYGDGSSLLATEVVERTDITNDYEIKRITASGLEIDPLDIFSDFNESEYDIVIKEL